MEIILQLVQNMAVVIVFFLIGNRLYPSTIHWNYYWRKTVIGILFGVAGVISMLVPSYVGAGTNVSLNNIVMALSAWIGGPLSAIVTAFFIVANSVYAGGIGMLSGVLATLTAAVIGVIFYYYRHADRRHSLQIVYPLVIGILVAFDNLAWALMIPDGQRIEGVRYYSLSLFIMFPLASILFHYFMNVEWTRQRELVIDDMTGLPHSGLFRSQVQKKIHEKTPFYLTLLNIDGLKTIITMNSTRVRNDLLKQISQRLSNWLPPASSACRLEGEQFLICVADPAGKKLPLIGPNYWQELQALLSEPYIIDHKLCHVTISTGITTYKGEALTWDQILPRAYTALQHARESGVNETVQYHEKLSEHIRQRTLIEVYLRTALQENQLLLHYQPQYELHTGALRGFEALLRWNHPELGSVSPSDFIPVAEETRLIVPIGEWVLRQACEMMKRIVPGSSSLVLSVNISGVQLLNHQFPALVSEILKETGVHPNRLELELTESTLMNSLEIAEKQLKKLQNLGVRLALDDFGTGYSSMNYLRKLPFHLIKIDKSFIQDIGNSTEREVAGSMIQFCKQLQFGIVAEGLETYEQLVYLKKYNCDYAQGYLFSKPLPEEQLLPLIEAV
ncbi:putative bifunctional diguanylate cyclase/phosphodiesterase [Cohnella endophytica]|nr:EAL domain-containing protein [Cohnella endophytica]